MSETTLRWNWRLWGRKFVVITDHSSLVWMREGEGLRSRVDKWARTLDEFRFAIKFRKGKENVVADCLSRAAHQERVKCLLLVIKECTKMNMKIRTLVG